MNCIMHYKREANFICQKCHQPICEECMRTLGGLCVFCAEQLKKDIKKKFRTTIIWSIVLGIIGFFFGLYYVSPCFARKDDILGIILITFLITIQMVFAPYGWNSLSRLTSNFFLILPFAGWFIYFILKGALSLIIGWIVAIPKFIQLNKNLQYAKILELNIQKINNIM